ncbi:MAG: ribulose-phosphate 3-epimerase [Phycisphaerae bacterium]|jgi:ribulose-phosphate 3-epimerase
MSSFPQEPGIRIAPSVLAADFGRLAEQVGAVESAGVEVLHLDVMDGHFVPNISFGVPVVKSLRKRTKLFLDAHLMITEPKRYAEAFVTAGSDLITFHIEAIDDPPALVDHIRGLGVAVGVSLNPTTPASSIESIVGAVDLVLVMSVWPGFGGQKFIADVVPKVTEIRSMLGVHQRLQIDGGIDPTTIGAAAAAGADTFVAGTAVFRQPDPAEAMRKLHRLASEAGQRPAGR